MYSLEKVPNVRYRTERSVVLNVVPNVRYFKFSVGIGDAMEQTCSETSTFHVEYWHRPARNLASTTNLKGASPLSVLAFINAAYLEIP